MAQDEIESARAEVEQARAALLKAWAEWAGAQGEHLRESMLAEGKFTAMKQPEVTVALGDGVPALRADLAALAEWHRKALEDWGRELKAVPGESADVVWKSVERARLAFGALFHGRGYWPSSHANREWEGPSDWQFYVPGTGTARTSHIPPLGAAGAALVDAERAFSQASSNLRAEESLAAKHAAEELWEN
ncbi:hypothetical protein LJR045_002931 [Microbacterium sp. LjRoot45]|uniref:hypothetical protein n=1 Tax=Microbacterium sp. LjRoot45 TaxID=3342329 RepID=UPI003ECFF9B2